MKTTIQIFILVLLTLANGMTRAEVNERAHASPGTQAKINRIIAQAYATGDAPKDSIAVLRGDSSSNGRGVNLNLSVGSIRTSGNGPAPRENTVITRDNIVICLHCR